jgi:hypothetical protein
MLLSDLEHAARRVRLTFLRRRARALLARHGAGVRLGAPPLLGAGEDIFRFGVNPGVPEELLPPPSRSYIQRSDILEILRECGPECEYSSESDEEGPEDPTKTTIEETISVLEKEEKKSEQHRSRDEIALRKLDHDIRTLVHVVDGKKVPFAGKEVELAELQAKLKALHEYYKERQEAMRMLKKDIKKYKRYKAEQAPEQGKKPQKSKLPALREGDEEDEDGEERRPQRARTLRTNRDVREACGCGYNSDSDDGKRDFRGMNDTQQYAYLNGSVEKSVRHRRLDKEAYERLAALRRTLGTKADGRHYTAHPGKEEELHWVQERMMRLDEYIRKKALQTEKRAHQLSRVTDAIESRARKTQHALWHAPSRGGARGGHAQDEEQERRDGERKERARREGQERAAAWARTETAPDAETDPAAGTETRSEDPDDAYRYASDSEDGEEGGTNEEKLATLRRWDGRAARHREAEERLYKDLVARRKRLLDKSGKPMREFQAQVSELDAKLSHLRQHKHRKQQAQTRRDERMREVERHIREEEKRRKDLEEARATEGRRREEVEEAEKAPAEAGAEAAPAGKARRKLPKLQLPQAMLEKLRADAQVLEEMDLSRLEARLQQLEMEVAADTGAKAERDEFRALRELDTRTPEQEERYRTLLAAAEARLYRERLLARVKLVLAARERDAAAVDAMTARERRRGGREGKHDRRHRGEPADESVEADDATRAYDEYENSEDELDVLESMEPGERSPEQQHRYELQLARKRKREKLRAAPETYSAYLDFVIQDLARRQARAGRTLARLRRRHAELERELAEETSRSAAAEGADEEITKRILEIRTELEDVEAEVGRAEESLGRFKKRLKETYQENRRFENVEETARKEQTERAKEDAERQQAALRETLRRKVRALTGEELPDDDNYMQSLTTFLRTWQTVDDLDGIEQETARISSELEAVSDDDRQKAKNQLRAFRDDMEADRSSPAYKKLRRAVLKDLRLKLQLGVLRRRAAELRPAADEPPAARRPPREKDSNRNGNEPKKGEAVVPPTPAQKAQRAREKAAKKAQKAVAHEQLVLWQAAEKERKKREAEERAEKERQERERRGDAGEAQTYRRGGPRQGAVVKREPRPRRQRWQPAETGYWAPGGAAAEKEEPGDRRADFHERHTARAMQFTALQRWRANDYEMIHDALQLVGALVDARLAQQDRPAPGLDDARETMQELVGVAEDLQRTITESGVRWEEVTPADRQHINLLRLHAVLLGCNKLVEHANQNVWPQWHILLEYLKTSVLLDRYSAKIVEQDGRPVYLPQAYTLDPRVLPYLCAMLLEGDGAAHPYAADLPPMSGNDDRFFDYVLDNYSNFDKAPPVGESKMSEYFLGAGVPVADAELESMLEVVAWYLRVAARMTNYIAKQRAESEAVLLRNAKKAEKGGRQERVPPEIPVSTDQMLWCVDTCLLHGLIFAQLHIDLEVESKRVSYSKVTDATLEDIEKARETLLGTGCFSPDDFVEASAAVAAPDEIRHRVLAKVMGVSVNAFSNIAGATNAAVDKEVLTEASFAHYVLMFSMEDELFQHGWTKIDALKQVADYAEHALRARRDSPTDTGQLVFYFKHLDTLELLFRTGPNMENYGLLLDQFVMPDLPVDVSSAIQDLQHRRAAQMSGLRAA